MVCEEAARAAGATLLDWRGRFKAREKGRADLVTEADLAAQKAIEKVVLGAFPEHGFVGEEEGEPINPDSQFQWIVDPLDGTTNYVHDVPHYATSIALTERGKLLAGVVFDPVADECYSATAGEGTKLNGTPVRTSGIENLADALVAASFPPQVTKNLQALSEMIDIMPHCQAIRRGGSAALNLAYIAAGRFDAYWARDLYPWDAAAGVLLIQEAGGVVTDPQGKQFDPWKPLLLAGASQELHRQLGELLQEV